MTLRPRAGTSEGNTMTEAISLHIGESAPEFELTSDAGNAVSLSSFRGAHLVVFFYPKDNTPGCTRETEAFRDRSLAFKAAGTAVIGISRDSVASHRKFSQKLGLAFPLLSDPDGSVHRQFGAFGDKMMYGKKVTGPLRTTVVIDPDGRIAHIFSKVKVDGHVDAVLGALSTSRRSNPA